MTDVRWNKNPKTSPFATDGRFKELSERIGSILKANGLSEREQRGSKSWVGYLPGEDRRRTIAKLCYYGADEAAFFGVREEAIPPEIRDVAFPVVRGVPPRIGTKFHGLCVALDASDGEDQIKRLITCLSLGVGADNEAFLEKLEARGQNKRRRQP